MTKEEADEKVREAKAAVVHAVKRACNLDSPNLQAALAKLSSAEAARAALDKPRLMTPAEHAGMTWANPFPPDSGETTRLCVKGAVLRDRADILAQAEKLPRYSIERPAGGIASGFGRAFGMTAVVNEPAILLSDLRNLINGGAD